MANPITMRSFVFTVKVRGYGTTQEAAWQHAVEEFTQDPGTPHETQEEPDDPGLEEFKENKSP